jgi:hypothetical protein
MSAIIEAEALTLIHDGLDDILDAIAKHGVASRELGQVEHKVIEAKLWLSTVPGAFEAIVERNGGEAPTPKVSPSDVTVPVAAPLPPLPAVTVAPVDTGDTGPTEDESVTSTVTPPDATPSEDAAPAIAVAPATGPTDIPASGRRTLLERLERRTK